MATKPSTGRGRSTSRSKGASTRKQNEARRKAQQQMHALIVFAVGILLGAFALIEGASVWNWLHNTFLGIFGVGAVFVAVLLLYIAVMLTLDKPVKGRAWLGAALIVCICGAFTIFGDGIPPESNKLDMLVSLIKGGINSDGGGLVGALLGYPLLMLFDKLGAGIIIVLLLFLLLMLLTGGTLIGLMQAAHRPVRKMGEVYTDQRLRAEERASQTPQKPTLIKPLPQRPVRASAGRIIDIPLEDDPKPEETPAKTAAPEATVSPEEPATVAATTAAAASRKFEIDIPLDDPFVPGKDAGFTLMNSHEAMEFVQPAPPSLDELVSSASTDTGRFAFAGSIPLIDDDPLPTILPAPEHPRYEDDSSDGQPLHDTIPTDDPFFSESAQKQARATPDEAIQAELSAVVEQPPKPVYRKPPVTLLRVVRSKGDSGLQEEMKTNAQRLVDTLASFGVQTRIVDISRGPAVTRYELQPSAGVKISRITGLADDIALNLAATGVRIEAPIPGKGAVGIEVPNKDVSTVSLREMIQSDEFDNASSKLSVALGRDITGRVMLADLAKMPHMLIAGSTGSGKSVCINSIIMSLLFKSTPDEVRFLMIDPKVVELGVYNGIPHLLVPVVTEPKKAAGALSWAVTEMMKRYKLFADNSVRDLNGFNALAARTEGMQPMPQVVIIIDELADLMMAAPNEVQDYICRLAQMARAAGMHLLIATQRPSVDVITGVIKANIPSRIAFAVSSQIDSRTILDMGGAEKLLGRGDMLFSPVGASKPMRVQGCFVTDEEIEAVISFIKNDATSDYDQQIVEDIDNHVVAGGKGGSKTAAADAASDSDEDDMLMPAIECVVEAGMASTSLLQRRLKLGYARAARIVDQMEARGIVGPFEGSKPRQVLISPERLAEMKLSQAD